MAAHGALFFLAAIAVKCLFYWRGQHAHERAAKRQYRRDVRAWKLG